LSHPELLTEKLKSFIWKRVGISSVVREATDALRKIFPNATFVSANLNLPIKIDYKTTETLGADRIANACGGLEFGESFAVVSAGTAVVVDLVRDSVFQGGVVFPGLKTMAKALNLETSQLPEIETLQRFQIPGKSTTECIESGILITTIGGIKEVLKIYETDTILITGGDSEILKKFLENAIFIPDLTFKGISKILDQN
jgi:type III pantothenate kinase